MIRIVLVAMVMTVGLMATGCRSCPLGGKGGQASPAASREERRTVTFVQRSETDVREHYDTWAREGWAVQSLSGPLPQADGTILRRAELARAQAPASTSK